MLTKYKDYIFYLWYTEISQDEFEKAIGKDWKSKINMYGSYFENGYKVVEILWKRTQKLK